MKIEEVSASSQIITVQKLANEIWNEYYPAIIGQDQVDYMLKTFQSTQAIQDQLNKGYRYFLLHKNEDAIGYFSIQRREDSLFLSKLYIRQSQRRKSYATQTVAFICALAHSQGVNSITLTVNKYNDTAIKSYEKMGFIRTGSLVQDISNGFVMDDFCYEYRCRTDK